MISSLSKYDCEPNRLPSRSSFTWLINTSEGGRREPEGCSARRVARREEGSIVRASSIDLEEVLIARKGVESTPEGERDPEGWSTRYALRREERRGMVASRVVVWTSLWLSCRVIVQLHSQNALCLPKAYLWCWWRCWWYYCRPITWLPTPYSSIMRKRHWRSSWYHGKKKFRFCSKLMLCMMNDDSFSEVLIWLRWASLCFSDRADGNGGTHFVLSMNPTSEIVEGTSICHTIKPSSYLAGNLAFLAYIIGKRKLRSLWCNWCKSKSSDWKCVPCEDLDEDILWNIVGVNEHVVIYQTNMYTDDCMKQGVCISP